MMRTTTQRLDEYPLAQQFGWTNEEPEKPKPLSAGCFGNCPWDGRKYTKCVCNQALPPGHKVTR